MWEYSRPRRRPAFRSRRGPACPASWLRTQPYGSGSAGFDADRRSISTAHADFADSIEHFGPGRYLVGDLGHTAIDVGSALEHRPWQSDLLERLGDLFH